MIQCWKESTQNFEARPHLPEVFRSTFCMLTERRGKEILQFVHDAEITWRNAIETCLLFHYECIWRRHVHFVWISPCRNTFQRMAEKCHQSNCFGMKLALDGTRPSLAVQLHTPLCVSPGEMQCQGHSRHLRIQDIARCTHSISILTEHSCHVQAFANVALHSHCHVCLHAFAYLTYLAFASFVEWRNYSPVLYEHPLAWYVLRRAPTHDFWVWVEAAPTLQPLHPPLLTLKWCRRKKHNNFRQIPYFISKMFDLLESLGILRYFT